MHNTNVIYAELKKNKIVEVVYKYVYMCKYPMVGRY